MSVVFLCVFYAVDCHCKCLLVFCRCLSAFSNEVPAASATQVLRLRSLISRVFPQLSVSIPSSWGTLFSSVSRVVRRFIHIFFCKDRVFREWSVYVLKLGAFLPLVRVLSIPSAATKGVSVSSSGSARVVCHSYFSRVPPVPECGFLHGLAVSVVRMCSGSVFVYMLLPRT